MAHPYQGKRQQTTSNARAKSIANTESAEFGPPGEKLQAPQFIEDRHGPKYDNDTPNNWLRGMPSAEGKPSFDRSKGRR